MLTQLPPNHYSAVRALFSSLPHHLAVRALLSGAVPGQVYVDHPEQPGAALAWVQQRLFVAGTPAPSSLGAVLAHAVGPQARARGLRFLGLYAAAAAAPSMTSELAPLIQPAAARLYLELAGPPPRDWREVLPADYTLRAADQAVQTAGLAHVDQLREEMCSERPSVAAFLAQSFGVCAVQADALAGWCLSEYNHADACEVGIEVRPPHRGRRLATALTLALAENAARAGYGRIGWHCYAANTASVATARAAGFAVAEEYPAWVVELA